MYNATFFEMLSEHTVAERLADAERKRTARAVIDRPSTGLTLPVDRLHLLLARTLRRLTDHTQHERSIDDAVRRSRLEGCSDGLPAARPPLLHLAAR